jgi:hypothetical protein
MLAAGRLTCFSSQAQSIGHTLPCHLWLPPTPFPRSVQALFEQLRASYRRPERPSGLTLVDSVAVKQSKQSWWVGGERGHGGREWREAGVPGRGGRAVRGAGGLWSAQAATKKNGGCRFPACWGMWAATRSKQGVAGLIAGHTLVSGGQRHCRRVRPTFPQPPCPGPQAAGPVHAAAELQRARPAARPDRPPRARAVHVWRRGVWQDHADGPLRQGLAARVPGGGPRGGGAGGPDDRAPTLRGLRPRNTPPQPASPTPPPPRLHTLFSPTHNTPCPTANRRQPPPDPQVVRTHFHDFMLDVHSRLRHAAGEADPLRRVADEIGVGAKARGELGGWGAVAGVGSRGEGHARPVARVVRG